MRSKHPVAKTGRTKFKGFVPLMTSMRSDLSFSIVLNVSTTRPHAGHRRILDSLRPTNLKNRPSNFEELYQGWLTALSTKTLNERFYKELANWFFWARDLGGQLGY